MTTTTRDVRPGLAEAVRELRRVIEGLPAALEAIEVELRDGGARATAEILPTRRPPAFFWFDVFRRSEFWTRRSIESRSLESDSLTFLVVLRPGHLGVDPGYSGQVAALGPAWKARGVEIQPGHNRFRGRVRIGLVEACGFSSNVEPVGRVVLGLLCDGYHGGMPVASFDAPPGLMLNPFPAFTELSVDAPA